MGHITIHVTDVSGGDNDTVQYNGVAVLEDNTTLPFVANVAQGSLAATINEGIKDAAIAAAAEEPYNYTVGLLDKKTLLGGAVGL